MFGLALYSEFIQGSAIRTWNCAAQLFGFVWYKFARLRHPSKMPRSRRRHHSRSRSRSRSHSHDRDREPKRRKIESFDSPHQRRSVSSEPEANEIVKNEHKERTLTETNCAVSETVEIGTMDVVNLVDDHTTDENDDKTTDVEDTSGSLGNTSLTDSCPKIEPDAPISAIKTQNLTITPKKAMSPKQQQKKLESEKKRLERQKEKEDREKKRQEERDEKLKAKVKLKQDKEDMKQKEKEVKDKEKEQKRKEREEKDEQKRKKQLEADEKNREKQKLEEQKQKAAAAFVNFFVPKKADTGDDRKREEIVSSLFMPFEIKSDMRLAPIARRTLGSSDKEVLLTTMETQDVSQLYLHELRNGKIVGKFGKTWPYDDGSDDVLIIDDMRESIVQQKAKMKVKLLKFHENQRPPYYGTFRKKSKIISSRRPYGIDKDAFNYEVDSDDEWEDEEDGESVGSNEEEKEESENDNDYEVDNDVFVPHAYLSDDEGVDEEDEVVSPEAHKAMLKLLKNQFEEERKSKTEKIKPRVIGCVWYNGNKVDDAIDKYLQPLAVIYSNTITIKNRSDPMFQVKKEKKGLDQDLIPEFLRLIHGNQHKRMFIIREYLEYLTRKGIALNFTKIGVGRQMKQFAQWMKCTEDGPMLNKQCWIVDDNVMKEYKVDLRLPNNWDYVTK